MVRPTSPGSPPQEAQDTPSEEDMISCERSAHVMARRQCFGSSGRCSKKTAMIWYNENGLGLVFVVRARGSLLGWGWFHHRTFPQEGIWGERPYWTPSRPVASFSKGPGFYSACCMPRNSSAQGALVLSRTSSCRISKFWCRGWHFHGFSARSPTFKT